MKLLIDWMRGMDKYTAAFAASMLVCCVFLLWLGVLYTLGTWFGAGPVVIAVIVTVIGGGTFAYVLDVRRQTEKYDKRGF